MHGTYEAKLREQREIERTLVQGTARLCSGIFGKVCKAIQPYKTAEWLAAELGCSVRAAAYEISGEREPSARAIAVIVDLMTRRE